MLNKEIDVIPNAHIVVDARGIVTLRETLTFRFIAQVKVDPDCLREFSREVKTKFPKDIC